MRPTLVVAAMMLSIVALVPNARTQTKVCASLEGARRDVAMSVLRTQHPYDCCERTLFQCLTQKPMCPLVRRLADDVCRRAAAGQSRPDIERELARRAASVNGPKVQIDTSWATIAGDPASKVEIIAYVCARCPYCARLTPQLYRSVRSGRLHGKAKLMVRPFPLRSHPHSVIAAKAWLAAERLGGFWELLLQLYADFDHFDPAKLPDYAASKGMNRKRFRALLADPQITRCLVRIKKEGVRNDVDATPTLFVGRRKYRAELSLQAIEDFAEEQYDRLSGKW